METTGLLRLYSLAMRAASPLFPLYLNRRVKSGKEDAARLKERFGQASLPRPDGPLIWIHGASVGETMMALPIAEHLSKAAPNAYVLVTSGTKTSAEMLSQRLQNMNACHQYLPADNPAYIERFLDHWRPDFCLWLESEIWPNILRATKKRNTPMWLLNARLSETSRTGWKKRPKTARALFSMFDEILTADDITAQFLSNLMGQNIPLFGNLKRGAPPLPVDADAVDILRTQFKTPYLWCAASTHQGEDNIILAAHLKILEQYPLVQLILVPRHPERAEEIAELITRQGLKHARWGDVMSDKASIYLVDKIGKLGPIYTLSKHVLMGGSLLPHLRGHNPLEPAHMNCAILSGPNVSSFETLYQDMFEAKAAKRLNQVTAAEIADEIMHWFKTDHSQLRYAQNAKRFSTEHQHITERLFNRLKPSISALNEL